MKKVLYITPYNITKKEVGGAFAYQFTGRLSEKAKLDIILYQNKNDVLDLPDNPNIRVLKKITINKIGKYWSWIQTPRFFPLFTARYSKCLIRYIKKIIDEEKYDYVVFDYSQTFAMAKAIDYPNKLLITHDVIYQRYLRNKSGFLGWVKWSEERLMNTCRKLYSFSEKDRDIIKQLYGIDSDVTPVFIKSSILDKKPTEIGDYHVFFGDWSRFDNFESLKWFVENVAGRVPNEKFRIIGGGLSLEFQAHLDEVRNVDYMGFVDDPYQIISNAKSLVTPLHYGAGIKVKCLEALACGTPLIGTSVAFEGISKVFSDAMFMADTPEQYISALLTVRFTFKQKYTLQDKFQQNYSQKSIIDFILNN